MKDQILIGKNSVIEAFHSGKTIEKIYMDRALKGEVEIAIRKLSTQHKIPLAKVPVSKINDLAHNKQHQGLIAFVSPIQYQKVEDILPMIYDKGEMPLFVMLDGVSDVRNLGGIARSAWVMGAHALIYAARDAARINEFAIKSSAGALLQIPVCRVPNIQDSIQYLKESGVQILATALDASVPIGNVDMTGPTAIIMGAEEKGLGKHILRLADQNIIIPQQNNFDSLNVSVATGVALYEINRQRSI